MSIKSRILRNRTLQYSFKTIHTEGRKRERERGRERGKKGGGKEKIEYMKEK